MRLIAILLLLAPAALGQGLESPSSFILREAFIINAFWDPTQPVGNRDRIFVVEAGGVTSQLRCTPTLLLHCGAVVKGATWTFRGALPADDADYPELIVQSIEATQPANVPPLSPPHSLSCVGA